MRRIVTLLVSTLIATTVFADKVAVISKVKGEVFLRKVDSPIYNPSVTMGTLIEKYDQIKVDNGFAVMLLLDERSQIKLRKNTEVAITIVEEQNGEDYRIRLDYGQTLTNFRTRPGAGFHLTTPTSVVSVKGTSFWTNTNPETGDDVIVLEGVVEVRNNMSGSTTTASAGQTVRSAPDGNISVAPTVKADIPEDPEADSKVMNEKDPKRDLGFVVGLVMVILVAILL